MSYNRLIEAINASDFETARVLIKKIKSQEINKTDRQGYSILTSACGIRGIDETIIEALLKHTNINVTLVNSDGNTALHYYCQNSSSRELFPNILNMFLKRGGNLSLRNNIGETPVFKGLFNHTLVFFLLPFFYSIGLDFYVVTFSGDTLLHYSVRIGNLKMVKMLVEDFKIDVGIRNKYGQLPIDLAHFPKNDEIIEYLTPISPNSELTDSGLTKPLPHFDPPPSFDEFPTTIENIEQLEHVKPKKKGSNILSKDSESFLTNIKKKASKARPTQSLPNTFTPSSSTPDFKALDSNTSQPSYSPPSPVLPTAGSTSSIPACASSPLSSKSTPSIPPGSQTPNSQTPGSPNNSKPRISRNLTTTALFDGRRRSITALTGSYSSNRQSTFMFGLGFVFNPNQTQTVKEKSSPTEKSPQNGQNYLTSQDIPKPFRINDEEAEQVKQSLEYSLARHSEIEHVSTGAIMINDLFFSKLFELNPEVKIHFPSIQKQSRFISELLSTIRVVVERPETLKNMSTLKDWGEKYKNVLGVEGIYYHLGLSLKHALQLRLREHFSDIVESSWTKVFAHMSFCLTSSNTEKCSIC